MRELKPLVQDRLSVSRIDDVIDIERLGGAGRRARGDQLRLQILMEGDRVVGGLDLTAVSGVSGRY